ncbi:PLD-like domain-containing protein [Frankineae bacterium MT45]|nr:PLD-like domain-containing protein [Frankineae bacterium MT45]
MLTRAEAGDIADRLEDGDTLSVALKAVDAGRREAAARLISDVLAQGLAGSEFSVALRMVQGARSLRSSIDSIWTMPGNLVQHAGGLTGAAAEWVAGASESVTCSTFNFQKSSALWETLKEVANRPGCVVRIYIDAQAADRDAAHWKPSTTEIAAHLHPARTFRTRMFDGGHVRNHAKFIAVDHRFLLVTSANFSASAEKHNVEFGVRIDDRALTEHVESTVRKAEDAIYERVIPVR